MLRNVILIFALAAMLHSQSFAQETKKTVCFDAVCLSEVANKLKSADKTTVAEAESTLAELANEAGRTHNRRQIEALKDIIIPYVLEHDNGSNTAYMMSLLSKFCLTRDIQEIMKMGSDERLADYAIRTVGEIKGSEEFIRSYIENNKSDLKYKGALAYAVGQQNMSDMENELISWQKGADDKTLADIYNALLIIGSNDKTTAIVNKGAKRLTKSKIPECQIAGLRLLVALHGEKALPYLYKALKNDNRNVRVEALNLMKPYANQDVCNNVVKKCKTEPALADAITWLGELKNDSFMELIITQLSSKNPELVEASIRAIFKIDNADGINAVKPMFGGDYQPVIKESMIAYEGDYVSVLNAVARGNNNQKLAALEIIECRPVLNMHNRVREMLSSDNPDIRDKAYSVLKLVVISSHTSFLMGVLEYCDDKYVKDVQLAIKVASENMPDVKKDEFASTLKHVKPFMMPRYYKVFAYFGTELCVDKLIDAYKNGPDSFEAKEALLLVNNEKLAEKIHEALK